MSSQVDICNQALSRLAAARIESFSDNTVESRECAAIFDLVSEEIQAKGPWPCNTIRTDLPQLSDAPSWGYTYQYTLPTYPRCLSVIELNGALANDVDFKIENGKLLTDESSVDIKYIGFITDTETFDSYLKSAIIDALVAQMAFKLTGQINVAEKMSGYAERRLKEHLANASIQGSSDSSISDTFTKVRYDG